MTRLLRLRMLAACLLSVAGVARAGELMLTPSFAAFQGFNDNVNAVPDDAAFAADRHESAFVQLRPGARLSLREGTQGALGLSYAAEWEKYDAASEGDTIGHLAGVDARLGGPQDVLRLTASGGFTGREVLGVRTASGAPYLNSRTWRGGAGAEFRVLKKGRLAVFTNYSASARRYPRYLAPTDADNPGNLEERAESLQSLTMGISSRPLDAVSVQWSVQGLQNDGNVLSLQQGLWRDFFSWRGKGSTLTLTGAPWRSLVCSVSGSWLRRDAAERLVPATGEKESSSSLSGTASLYWFVSRSAGLSVEYQQFRNESNLPRASFTNHRLLAGIRLSEDLKIF